MSSVVSSVTSVIVYVQDKFLVVVRVEVKVLVKVKLPIFVLDSLAGREYGVVEPGFV